MNFSLVTKLVTIWRSYLRLGPDEARWFRHILARSPRRFVAKPCAGLHVFKMKRRLDVREGSRRNSWVVVVDGVSKSWSVFQRMCTDEERQERNREVAAARAAVQHCGA